MKIFILTISIFALINSIFSQSDMEKDSVKYSTHTVQDYRIEKIEKTYEISYQLEGYRIQIYSGTKSKPAKQARLQFSQKHKTVKAHETYQQPFFKVRVGDFKTKLEALKFQKEIIVQFPDCYIVKDEIEFEEG